MKNDEKPPGKPGNPSYSSRKQKNKTKKKDTYGVIFLRWYPLKGWRKEKPKGQRNEFRGGPQAQIATSSNPFKHSQQHHSLNNSNNWFPLLEQLFKQQLAQPRNFPPRGGWFWRHGDYHVWSLSIREVGFNRAYGQTRPISGCKTH